MWWMTGHALGHLDPTGEALGNAGKQQAMAKYLHPYYALRRPRLSPGFGFGLFEP